MNQFSENQGGSFQLPTSNGQFDVPFVPKTNVSKSDSFEVIFVGPGKFAAKDPYVGENELESSRETHFSESTASPSTDLSAPMSTTPNSPNAPNVHVTVNVGQSNPIRSDSAESAPVEQSTSEDGETDLGNENAEVISPARTLESILASIPGYCEEAVEQEIASQEESAEEESAEFVKDDSIAAAAPKSLAEELTEKLSKDRRFNFPQPEVAPIPIVASTEEAEGISVSVEVSMMDAIEMNSPAAETEIAIADESFPPVSWFANETTLPPTNQTPVPFLDMSVPAPIADPVSGEEVFDIKDFMDEVNALIPPIPGAFQDTTIVSLAVTAADSTLSSTGQPDPKELLVANENVVQMGCDFDSAEPVDCNLKPVVEAPTQEPEEPSELESALAACTEVAGPMCKVDSDLWSPPLESTQTTADDNLFIASEGDVIQIDGNDGYEFIDLACFQVDAAIIKPGRIVILDDSSSAFEIYYKNIHYALFADDKRVDLPPTT